MKMGSRLDEYLCSTEPLTRTMALLLESARRLRIPQSVLPEIIKPYTVYVQRLPVVIVGQVVNMISGIVLHNRARGPYKGGIRIAPDVTLWETGELARLMTLKTALADLELGGGKSGISVDLRALYADIRRRRLYAGSYRDFESMAKASIMAEFTHHFGWLFAKHAYIPAPDMGTGGAEMVCIYNELRDPAAVTGKPDGIEGWLPGRKESTGYGVAYATLKHMERLGRSPDRCTVAIQGFGKVGSYAALYLFQAGARIIAVTDLTGGVFSPEGIDIPELMRYTARQGRVGGFLKKNIDNAHLFRLDCDYLIPAASGNVIHDKNAVAINARVIVEGANMPVTYEAMQKLRQKRVEILPDIFANAGGVIASNLEYRQALGGAKFSFEQVLAHIRGRFDEMWETIYSRVRRNRTFLDAAVELALERVYEAMLQRRLI